MQTILNKKLQAALSKDITAVDRYETRITIAKLVSNNVSSLSSQICRTLMLKAMKDIYGKRRK